MAGQPDHIELPDHDEPDKEFFYGLGFAVSRWAYVDRELFKIF